MTKRKVTLVGTGGKMGLSLTSNLIRSDYKTSYLEVNPVGIIKLNEKGATVSRGRIVFLMRTLRKTYYNTYFNT